MGYGDAVSRTVTNALRLSVILGTASKAFNGGNLQKNSSLFHCNESIQALDLIDIYLMFQSIMYKTMYSSSACRVDSEGAVKSCIRHIKAKNFYYCVQLALGVQSARGVAQKFNREMRSAGAPRPDSKKWRYYRSGAHYPRPSTVTQAEKVTQYPLRQEMNLVLWTAVDASEPLGLSGIKLIRKLPSDVAESAEVAYRCILSARHSDCLLGMTFMDTSCH